MISDIIIRIISQFASKYNDAELTSYLSGLDNFTTGSSAPKPFCNNTALNATLHVYYSSAVSKLINTEVRFIMPSKPVLSDIEFCTDFSNLFENAIEACEKLETDKRRISLNCRDTSGSYFLLIENTYNGEYKKQDHVFVSSKTGPARLGIGLESVTGIIEKKWRYYRYLSERKYFQRRNKYTILSIFLICNSIILKYAHLQEIILRSYEAGMCRTTGFPLYGMSQVHTT